MGVHCTDIYLINIFYQNFFSHILESLFMIITFSNFNRESGTNFRVFDLRTRTLVTCIYTSGSYQRLVFLTLPYCKLVEYKYEYTRYVGCNFSHFRVSSVCWTIIRSRVSCKNPVIMWNRITCLDIWYVCLHIYTNQYYCTCESWIPPFRAKSFFLSAMMYGLRKNVRESVNGCIKDILMSMSFHF
jgi:hypothetical protein